MELGKKKATIIMWAIALPLTAVLIGLEWMDILDYGWVLPLLFVIMIIAGGIVKFIQKRVDPEAYQASKRRPRRKSLVSRSSARGVAPSVSSSRR